MAKILGKPSVFEPVRISQKNDIVRSVYEAEHSPGKWVVSDWGLQKSHEAKLDVKMAMLFRAEVDPKTRKCSLPTGLLAGPGVYGEKWIYKLKVRTNVQLRPMLCLGPKEPDKQWTVVARATEVQNKLVPLDAATTGEKCRQEILNETRKNRLKWEQKT